MADQVRLVGHKVRSAAVTDDIPQPAPRLLYDKSEAARLLSISFRTLDRLHAEGEIETVSLGRRRLVAHADLEAYVARLRAER